MTLIHTTGRLPQHVRMTGYPIETVARIKYFSFYIQTFSVRTTMLALCEVVCDQYTIPTPDIQAGLRFTGIKRIKTGKVEEVEDMVAEAFIWAGDSLVYECEQPQFGILGGVDTVLDR